MSMLNFALYLSLFSSHPSELGPLFLFPFRSLLWLRTEQATRTIIRTLYLTAYADILSPRDATPQKTPFVATTE